MSEGASTAVMRVPRLCRGPGSEAMPSHRRARVRADATADGARRGFGGGDPPAGGVSATTPTSASGGVGSALIAYQTTTQT